MVLNGRNHQALFNIIIAKDGAAIWSSQFSGDQSLKNEQM